MGLHKLSEGVSTRSWMGSTAGWSVTVRVSQRDWGSGQ